MVDNRSLQLTGAKESDRGRPPDGLLLDSSFDGVFMRTQLVDEDFGLGIGGQRNNQTADERERDPGLAELAADLPKGGLE